ncbi:hypothetical protein, partial [Brachyspira hampsonii]
TATATATATAYLFINSIINIKKVYTQYNFKLYLFSHCINKKIIKSKSLINTFLISIQNTFYIFDNLLKIKNF